jgi:polyhydroxyalkanoate synthesis regulator phasin
MSSNKTIAAVVLTTVALSIGTVGVASASQSKSNTKAISVRQTTVRTSVNSMVSMGKMDFQGSGLNTVLVALVANNTITQDQANKITAAMVAARTAQQASEGENRAAKDARRVARETLIATTIGKTPAEIKAGLAAGQSLGAIAGEKRTALITALVADETKQIDTAVAAGKMTAEQATKLKADLTAHVTAQVDAIRPAKDLGMGKGAKMGRHGVNH